MEFKVGNKRHSPVEINSIELYVIGSAIPKENLLIKDSYVTGILRNTTSLNKSFIF